MTLHIKIISSIFFLRHFIVGRYFRNRQSIYVDFDSLTAKWLPNTAWKRAVFLVVCRWILRIFPLPPPVHTFAKWISAPFFLRSFFAVLPNWFAFVCNSISVARVPQCPPISFVRSSFSNYILLWCLRQLERIFQLRVISTDFQNRQNYIDI